MQTDVFDPLLQVDHDPLHTEFIARFHELLMYDIQPPYAISIDGLWGTGKTAIMRKLQTQLHQQGYPVFWYNPWKYRQTDNVVLAFLQSLYLTAADSQCFPELCAHGTTILQLLVESGLDAGLRLLTNRSFLGHNMCMSSLTSLNAQETGVFEDYDYAARTIEQEFVELLVLISRHHQHKPVIIFVDDLDRCLPGDVVHFLEALQHVFLVQGGQGVFICGIDTHIACQYLYDQHPERGKLFAEHAFRRIFPVTLSMPYSANVKEVISKYIATMYQWDDPVGEQAKALTRIIYTRGLQSNIFSVHKFLNIAGNFVDFLQKHSSYAFCPENDFVLNVLIIKEAWPELYERLLIETTERPFTMQQLIQHMMDHNWLLAEQEKFLTAYVGRQTPFARERLAVLVARYPMLEA